tara:strand:+ start:39086 stop:40003 length:918 start_codon:yes stop_codon:yes gene_type:complete
LKETFTISDHLNKKLHAVVWTTDHKPKGVILIVHGLAEHSGRYSHFAKFLNSNNYHVFAYDHRGHGKTDPDHLGVIDHNDEFNLMVKNLNDVFQYVSSAYPNLPIILFGHSMGSFISQRFMQLYDAKPDALIYSGSNGKPPLLLHAGIQISALLKSFFGKDSKSNLLDRLSFGAYNRHFKPNRTDYDWLSRDTDMVDLYVDDPLCGFICSNSFYHQLFKGIQDIHAHPVFADHNPDIPVLLLSGDQDPVSNFGKGIRNLEKIMRKSGVSDITTHLYEGGRHEMLNEINRDEVFDNLLQWMNLEIE